MWLTIVAQLSLTPWTSFGPLPQTVPFYNMKTKEQIGTATINGDTTYFRDMKGEHLYTIVIKDGVKTLYDPHGKILDQQTK